MSIVERYGPPEDDGTGSTGVLLPNQVARLVDPETGKDVAMGQEGELWIAGPNRMKGYLNRPDATAETLAGDFLKTGDLAVVDERGRIFIQDRLKELIKVKGGVVLVYGLRVRQSLTMSAYSSQRIPSISNRLDCLLQASSAHLLSEWTSGVEG